MSSASRKFGYRGAVITHASLRRRRHVLAALRRLKVEFSESAWTRDGNRRAFVRFNEERPFNIVHLAADAQDWLYEAAVGPDATLGAPHVHGHMLREDREVYLASLETRLAEAIWLSAAGPAIELAIPGLSYAYGPRRHRWAALLHVRAVSRRGYHWARRFDIAKFFPSVGTDLVIEALRARTRLWPTMTNVVRGFMAYSIRRPPEHPLVLRGEASIYESARHSLLQGTIVAPTLSNVVGAHVVDIPLSLRFGAKALIFRYADDGLVLAQSPDAVDEAIDYIRSCLSGYGLSMHDSPAKTSPVATDLRLDEIRFLGKQVSAGRTVTTDSWWKQKIDVAAALPEGEEGSRRRRSLVQSTMAELLFDRPEVIAELFDYAGARGLADLVAICEPKRVASRQRLLREFDRLMPPLVRKILAT